MRVELRGRRLPAELELGQLVGEGRRSVVVGGRLDGCEVVVKFYRRKHADKHRRRFGESIARFEHDRNASFFAVPELRPHVARPIRVLGEDDNHDVAFVQERIDATPLRQVVAEQGRVPDEILMAVRELIDHAEAAGLHDIDLNPDNLLVRRTEIGWVPMLSDFNMIPQHLRAPNPWVAFLYRVGLREPSYRDRRWLRVLGSLRA